MNISVIIPIHEFNDDLSPFVNKAVESVATQKDVDELPKIYFVFPTEIKEGIVGFKEAMLRKYKGELKIELVENDGDSGYQAQVNLGVKSIDTEFFTVLEFDDEFSTTYFKNALKYIEAYPKVDMFLTMMIEVNEKNEGLKTTNEMVWSQQFVGENGEMGYLNQNALKQYTDFKLSGAIIKKSEFEAIGGYKSNIKLTFMYEFLLRALNNNAKIFTISKIGYKHLANRENSLFDIYQKTMPVEERRFWFETAANESNFMNDRVIDTSVMTQAKK